MRLFLLFSFCLITGTAICQVSDTVKVVQKNRIGMHAGVTTGLGFSYRYKPNKLGIQITGAPIFDGQGNTIVSAGLSGMYNLNAGRKADLFSYFGNHLFQNGSNTTYNVGLGLGVDIHPWRNVLDISLQAGYGVFSVNDHPLSIPTIEAGLYYRF